MHEHRWLIGPIPAIGVILRGECLPERNILRVLVDDIVIVDLHERHVIIALPREVHPLPQRTHDGLIGTWDLLDRLLDLGAVTSQVKDIPKGWMGLGLYEGVLLREVHLVGLPALIAHFKFKQPA